MTVERVSASTAERLGLPRVRKSSADLSVIRATLPRSVSTGDGTSCTAPCRDDRSGSLHGRFSPPVVRIAPGVAVARLARGQTHQGLIPTGRLLPRSNQCWMLSRGGGSNGF